MPRSRGCDVACITPLWTWQQNTASAPHPFPQFWEKVETYAIVEPPKQYFPPSAPARLFGASALNPFPSDTLETGTCSSCLRSPILGTLVADLRCLTSET
jgi:hypothetical protein